VVYWSDVDSTQKEAGLRSAVVIRVGSIPTPRNRPKGHL